MNFLAHAVLAGRSAEQVAGSIAGDFVKGVLYEQDFPAEFLTGLRLHRRIDAFSNRETYLRTSANRMPQRLRRIAPPCIDMIADHFLAREAATNPALYLQDINGFEQSGLNLLDYEDTLYKIIKSHRELLSPQARRFFDHAKSTRLLSGYQSFDRTARGINYVCERLGRAADGPAMVDALEASQSALYQDFLEYWPALESESRRFLAIENS